MKTLAIIVFSYILLGCHSDSQTSKGKDTTAFDSLEIDGIVTDTSVVNATSEISKEIKTFKGLYISGDEVSTFRDCATGKVYWLEDESKKLLPAYKKAMAFLSYPYESTYAEVKGYLKGKSNIGYAQEYENVLAVTNVNLVQQKSFKTECYMYEFVALGNEPFWSLDIIPEEKLIVLKDVGSEKAYKFPYQSGKSNGNITSYETSNDEKETLKVVITKEPCSDSMSENKYNYSAQVTLNAMLLKGCAIKKGEKFLMNNND